MTPRRWSTHNLPQMAEYQAKRVKECDCDKDLNWLGRVGNQAQNQATDWFRSTFKSWTGLGDYTIQGNSLIAGGTSDNSSMQIVSISARELRVKYREYIGDVFTHPTVAGEFYQQNYAINPGLVDNFPWFAPIAQQYQQWEPNGIIWEFKSTSGDITNDQALGKIIFATDYNTSTLGTSFTNQQEMLAEAYAQEGIPSRNMFHGLECDPSERSRRLYFIRSGALVNEDLADYDLGQTTVATVGGPAANTNLGSLYIHYDVSLYKNTLNNGVPDKSQIVRYWTSDASVTTTNLFGLDRSLARCNQTHVNGSARAGVLDEDFTINDGGTSIKFPRWAYVGSVWKFTYFCVGSSTAGVLAPAVDGVGITTVSPSLVGAPSTSTTCATLCFYVYVKVGVNTANERPELTFTGGQWPTPVNYAFWQIENAPAWAENLDTV